MSYKATKPGLVLFYILARFNCIVAYYGPFLCIVNFRSYLFCLLIVLVKLSLIDKWLGRKTPLRKPSRGEGIISIKPRPKRAYDCVGLLYSFAVLLRDICVLYVIHFLLQWHDIAYLWTHAQRASMLYFADVFLYFFYGRLSWPNGWMDLHETFTRGRY